MFPQVRSIHQIQPVSISEDKEEEQARQTTTSNEQGEDDEDNTVSEHENDIN